MTASTLHPVRISAIIPTFNRASIVTKGVESVLRQQYPPVEVIVVDDGSSDNTREVLKAYGTRVRYFYQPNAGVSAARNLGVQEAVGDWVAFLDSDDCWLPDHLARVVQAIEATEGEAALYFADTQRANADGGDSYWQAAGFSIAGAFEFARDASRWGMLRVQPMLLQTSVIKKSIYQALGGLSNRLRTREDTLFFFKLAFLHPACAVSGFGTIMNAHDGIRLTRLHDSQSLLFWDASIFLFKDLLRSLRHLHPQHRRFLVKGLSRSYYSRGRFWLRRRAGVKTLVSLALAFFWSPLAFVREAYGSVSHRSQLMTGRAGLSK